jgi:hypothetical protein
MSMVKALLPTGREIYACERQRVCVFLEDKSSAKRIEKAIRRHLKDDPRYLTIEIQSEGSASSWQASIRWGDAKECREYPRLTLVPGEQTAQAVVGRISRELGRFQ